MTLENQLQNLTGSYLPNGNTLLSFTMLNDESAVVLCNRDTQYDQFVVHSAYLSPVNGDLVTEWGSYCSTIAEASDRYTDRGGN